MTTRRIDGLAQGLRARYFTRGRAGPAGAAATSAACAAGADAPADRPSPGGAPRRPGRDARRAPRDSRFARSSSSREPSAGSDAVPVRRRAGRRPTSRGRTRDAIRLPRYSSSVPAIASGTIGAPIAQRDQRPAVPERPDPAGRPADTVPSGIWAKTPPLAMTARADATWASTPTPPRQTGSSPPTRRMSHSRQRDVNVDGPLPRNHARGSRRDRVEDDERVHPAAVGRPDEQVAARAAGAPGRSSRSGTGTRRRGSTRARSRSAAVEQRRPRLRASGPASRGPRARRRGRRRAPGARSGRAAAGAVRGRSGRRPRRPFRPAGRRACRAGAGRRRRSRDRRPVGSSVAAVVRRRASAAARRVRSRPAGPARGGTRCSARPKTTNAERHDLGGRDAEERPVAAPEELEDEPGHAVPDEEDPEQVAGHEPLSRGGPARAGRSRRAGPRATRTGTADGSGSSPAGTRCTGRPRRGGRSRSRCPTAASSAARTAPG